MRAQLSLLSLPLCACALLAIPADLRCDAADFPRCDPDDPQGRLVCADGVILREDCGAGVCDAGICPCGNGARDAGEACDDGNVVDGDGCSACAIECNAGSLGADSAIAGAGHCYALFGDPLNFEDARISCEDLGERLGSSGHLATITSTAENQLLDDFSDVNFWIGGNDLVNEGTFEWVTGEDFLQFVNFNIADGEPDGGTDENCLVLDDISPGDDAWDTINCDTLEIYTCELE